MSPNLKGKVCLVTGATKGIGKGIALQLGSSGAKVYLTGRTEELLAKCAQEINERGGEAFPIRVDHANDEEVEALFERINREQNGQLDVLVNNAYAGVQTIFTNLGKKFWELDAAQTWDQINGIGLRGHYVCSVHGARLMTKNKKGLIVNVSSIGGMMYLFNVPYGVGKAGCDRMASDCAKELREDHVAIVSLWPGPVKTEFMQDNIINSDSELASAFSTGESVEFSGKAITHLASDPNYLSKTGQILLTGDLAVEYNFTDDNGEQHDMRSVSTLLKKSGRTWLSAIVPGFVRIPRFLFNAIIRSQ